jgi:hypothetical protein
MTLEKPGFEQFLEAVDEGSQSFIQDLHSYLTDNNCKVTVEEKKSGLFASYKHAKSKKVIANLLFRKKGPLVRIYGENTGKYLDFMNTLPQEMVQAIGSSALCKRLVHNTCSPKCSGYDVTIGGERFQKCRYGCFEFPVTNGNNPFIRSFVENELKQRV